MERVKDKEFFMSQRIYYGGNILTMDKDGTSDYLITENGKIKSLGKGTPPPLPVSAERYDLKGRTLMPAFMDPHSHISGCAARFLQVPLESCKTNEEIKSALETFLSQTALKAGEWIFACGYSGAALPLRIRLSPRCCCTEPFPNILSSYSINRGIWEYSTPRP